MVTMVPVFLALLFLVILLVIVFDLYWLSQAKQQQEHQTLQLHSITVEAQDEGGYRVME